MSTAESLQQNQPDQSDPVQEQDADFWLFGYGSLIWKPPPHFDKRVPGYITGYVRRFWQASEDHRGTPEAPGRVVTLIERSFWSTLDDPQRETEGDRVWGAAYHIIPEKVKEVKEYLDIREINGYSIQYTPFHPAGDAQIDPSVLSPGSHLKCLVYIGLPENPQFLGALPPASVAEVICRRKGPSGENREYLFQLEESLHSLGEGSRDAHVTDLAARVKSLLASHGPELLPGVEKAQEQHIDDVQLTKVGSTDEQEEIEKEV